MKKPLKGDAWLVRDKVGKMRRAIFFHPTHAEKYSNYELINSHTEVVKIRLSVDTTTYKEL